MKAIAPPQPDRTKFIGGSDTAGIINISPWKTPLDVYLDKIEPRAEDSNPDRIRVLTRGKRMEPYVVDLLQEETGLVIVRRNERYIDPEHSFMRAEIDAEAETGENVEIKTVSPFKAKEWGEEQTDAIPVHYTAQAMHGLMVTGRNVCVFGVLIGGDDFRVYRVERDDEAVAAIRAAEVAFWNDHIIPRIPPEPATSGDVLKLFSPNECESIEATAGIIEAVAELKDLKSRVKADGARIEELEELIKLHMRSAVILKSTGGTLATWKVQQSARFNQSAFKTTHPDLYEQFVAVSESRVLRIK